MIKLRKQWVSQWRLYSGLLASAACLGLLLLYHLGSLTPGLSNQELSQQQFASSWRHIWYNPLNAPLTVVQWLLLTIFSHHGSTVSRAPSVLFGLLAIGALAYVLRRWYGFRTAAFGTLILATSAWFLHVSRYGGTEVLYLWAIPTLLALYIAWERFRYRPIMTFFTTAVLGAMLYIPGLIWLILGGLALQPQHLIKGWKGLKNSWLRLATLLLLAGILAPLAISLVRDTSLLSSWLGLPRTFQHPAEVPRRLAQSVSFFVWRGPLRPELWLDRLPILSAFGIIMAILGTVFYAKHLQAPRTRLLGGLFVIGALLYALGGPVGFSMLVPVVYIVITAGVGYLLHEWLRVFPRNPIARSLGYGLLTVVVLLSCAYNLRAYFVAWPHSPSAKASFHTRH